ncbi:MAG: NACHT domain-containing protein [Umezawaea sp.]
MPSPRWTRPVVARVAATGLFQFLHGDGWELADQKSSVLGMLFGGAALLLGLAQWWHGRSAAPDTDRIAADLAVAVRAQWQREERVRGVHDPYPLPVRWTNAPPELADHWPTIHRDPDRDEPIDLEGTLDHVAEVYAAVPSGRLVVLGRPGSGKTVFTTRFVLGVESERVPVVFTLASWNPCGQDLREWTADQLERSYGKAAGGLVEAGRILPVLDGFDEIAPELRDKAIRGINAALGEGDPVVLTSRVDEYAASRDVVTGAAVIRLVDLAPPDVAKYLRLATRGDKWAPVLDRLAPVLDTPLMLTLARTVYETADPAELLEVDDPEGHLLSRFVPALYEESDTRYFGELARFLVGRGTHDLAWWELPGAVPNHPRLVLVALGFPLIGVALLLGSYATTLAVSVLVVVVSVGSAADRPPVRLRPDRWSGVLGAALVGGVGGLGVGLLAGLGPLRTALMVLALSAPTVAVAVGQDEIHHVVSDPDRLLRVDRAAAVVNLVKWALPAALIVSLVAGGIGREVLVVGLCVGAVQTVAYQAWGRFGLARAYLAATGRLPWRLMAFLREAHRRGVLRQAGPVYQFRHARLCDRLAEEHGQTAHS